MLRIAKKYPDRKFRTKKAVLSYMGKLLSHELRQTTEVNNTSFKFCEKDNVASAQEKYLQTVEDNLDTNRLSQLRRKIAGVFDTQMAYSLLFNANFKEKDNAQFVIKTKQKIQITNYQRQSLLREIQSIYGNHITQVILEPQIKSTANPNYQNPENTITTTPIDNLSVWGRVRLSLIQYFNDGLGLDHAWFSKLEAIYDHTAKQLTLKAPTKFIGDRIWQHYGCVIAKYCSNENYQLAGVQS